MRLPAVLGPCVPNTQALVWRTALAPHSCCAGSGGPLAPPHAALTLQVPGPSAGGCCCAACGRRSRHVHRRRGVPSLATAER